MLLVTHPPSYKTKYRYNTPNTMAAFITIPTAPIVLPMSRLQSRRGAISIAFGDAAHIELMQRLSLPLPPSPFSDVHVSPKTNYTVATVFADIEPHHHQDDTASEDQIVEPAVVDSMFAKSTMLENKLAPAASTISTTTKSLRSVLLRDAPTMSQAI
ncbi:hypothetical protein BC828DRAFT_381511 [Blastocladiella britannica]|nr:hypothetical protein BC828DRAFT_381511 [Blastocladiella britannica]